MPYLLTGMVFLFLFMPYLILGKNGYVRIHDNLEGEWIWLTTLVREHKALFFDFDLALEGVLGGIPRYMYPTGLSINILFIKLFGPYFGYVISKFIIHLVAFVGAHKLLQYQLLKDKSQSLHLVLLSLIFALIPFFVPLGITVAGMPLLLLCFIKMLDGQQNAIMFIYILCFPFYSSFVWGAPFINVLLISLFLIKQQQRVNLLWFLFGLLLLNTTYLLVNYPLIYTFLFNDIPLHREEYNPFLEWNSAISASIIETIYIFFLGHYHVGMLVTIPIFILSLLSFKDNKVKLLLSAVLIIALINGFYLYLVPMLESISSLLVSFVIKRVSILLPIIWLLLAAVSIKNMFASKWKNKFSLYILINMLVVAFFVNDECINNYKILFNINKKPGFNSFLSQPLYTKIKNDINYQDNQFVASLGLSPSIARYNGFNCIDGIASVYPLSHKHFMLEAQINELKKDTALFNYFNAWGNRCYLFSAELGFQHSAFMINKHKAIKIDNWSINTNLLKEKNLAFIFSAVEISNANDIGLLFIDTYTDNASHWKVYVYKLK